jgi:Zn-dependent protease
LRDPQSLILQFAILLLSLSVHEAAHAWTANRLGDPTARQLGRITLNPLAHIDWIGTVLFPLIAMYSGLPLFGWAKPVPVDWRNFRSPRTDFAVVAAAGPISNLLLASVVALFLFVLGGPGGVTSDMARYFIVAAIVMNCVLAVFNLLPVPPLDGGNVGAGLLPVPMARALVQVRPYGFIILYALMFLGVLDRVVFPIAYRIADWLIGVRIVG